MKGVSVLIVVFAFGLILGHWIPDTPKEQPTITVVVEWVENADGSYTCIARDAVEQEVVNRILAQYRIGKRNGKTNEAGTNRQSVARSVSRSTQDNAPPLETFAAGILDNGGLYQPVATGR